MSLAYMLHDEVLVKAKDEKCEGMYRRAKAMYEWLEGRGGKALIVRRLTAVLDDPHFETLPDGKLLKALASP